MRIISWNLQKGRKDSRDLCKLLDSWAADFAIFQEPMSGLLGRSSDTFTISAGRSAQNWTVHPMHAPGSSGQGHYSVLTTDGGQVENIMSYKVPGSAIPNPLAVFKLTLGAESWRVATCHAVFGTGSDGEATQYLTNAKKVIDELAAKNPSDRVDIWIGDFNTYGPTAPQGGRPTFRILLASPTGGKGSGGALDKILVSVDAPALRDAVCGRILHSSGTNAPHRNAPQDNISDYTEPTWKSGNDVISDHLPVYIDTKGAALGRGGMKRVRDETSSDDADADADTTKTPLFDSFPDPPKIKKRKTT